MKNTCRICLQTDDNIVCDIENYLPIVKRIAQIDLIFDERLSPKVCDDCVNELLNADLLRDKLLQCNELKIEGFDETEAEIVEMYEDEEHLEIEEFLNQYDEKFVVSQELRQESSPIKTVKPKKIEKDKMRYKCHICNTSVKRLPQHMKTFHPNEPLIYKCKYCDKTTDNIKVLHTHTFDHHQAAEICDECGAVFKRKARLIDHKVSIHTKVKEFVCDICSAKFARRCGLVSHIRTHTKAKPFKCKYCPKAYSHYSDFRTHEMSHTGEWRLHCPICNKGFYKPSTLKNHMKSHK